MMLSLDTIDGTRELRSTAAEVRADAAAAEINLQPPADGVTYCAGVVHAAGPRLGLVAAVVVAHRAPGARYLVDAILTDISIIEAQAILRRYQVSLCRGTFGDAGEDAIAVGTAAAIDRLRAVQ